MAAPWEPSSMVPSAPQGAQSGLSRMSSLARSLQRLAVGDAQAVETPVMSRQASPSSSASAHGRVPFGTCLGCWGGSVLAQESMCKACPSPEECDCDLDFPEEFPENDANDVGSLSSHESFQSTHAEGSRVELAEPPDIDLGFDGQGNMEASCLVQETPSGSNSSATGASFHSVSLEPRGSDSSPRAAGLTLPLVRTYTSARVSITPPPFERHSSSSKAGPSHTTSHLGVKTRTSRMEDPLPARGGASGVSGTSGLFPGHRPPGAPSGGIDDTTFASSSGESGATGANTFSFPHGPMTAGCMAGAQAGSGEGSATFHQHPLLAGDLGDDLPLSPASVASSAPWTTVSSAGVEAGGDDRAHGEAPGMPGEDWSEDGQSVAATVGSQVPTWELQAEPGEWSGLYPPAGGDEAGCSCPGGLAVSNISDPSDELAHGSGGSANGGGCCRANPAPAVAPHILDLPDECLLEVLRRINFGWATAVLGASLSTGSSSGAANAGSNGSAASASGSVSVGGGGANGGGSGGSAEWEMLTRPAGPLLLCASVCRRWRGLVDLAVERLRVDGGPPTRGLLRFRTVGLDSALARFRSLHTLELDRCRLAENAECDALLTSVAAACPQLRAITLSRMHDKRWEGVVTTPGLVALLEGCRGLQSLTLASALSPSVSALPAALFEMRSLRALRVADHRGLDPLPEGLGKLTGLRTLDLEFVSGMPCLPLSLGPTARTLERLTLWGCHDLMSAPPPGWLSSLSALRRLRLTWRGSLERPLAALVNLQNLQVLTLQCLRTGYLPASLGSLSSLQELRVEGGVDLVLAPGSLGQLTLLQTLQLDSCRELTTLPESLGSLAALRELRLRDCPSLARLPESVGRLRRLTSLRVAGCDGLSDLPRSLGDMTSLRRLSLMACKGLKELPESLRKLTGLVELEIHGCDGLLGLPEAVGELASLEALWMRNCEGVTFLPSSVGGLSRLRTLALGGCSGLVVLPKSVGRLGALAELRLSGCGSLLALPPGLATLPALRCVHLDRCNEALLEGRSSRALLSALRQRNVVVTTKSEGEPTAAAGDTRRPPAPTHGAGGAGA